MGGAFPWQRSRPRWRTAAVAPGRGRVNRTSHALGCAACRGNTRRGRPPSEDVLTPSEWRVVHAVQHGLSNREIARRRGISVDAVKYHVANAVAKLGVDQSRRPAALVP